MLVDYSVIENQLEDGLTLLGCHVVQSIANLSSPGQDCLHRSALCSSARRPGLEVIELTPEEFQAFGDEFALMVKLGLGDLPRYIQSDSAVLFHLDRPQLALRFADLLIKGTAVLSVEGLDPRHNQVGVLKDALVYARSELE